MEEIINGKNLDLILEYSIEIYKSDNGWLFLHELRKKVFPDFTPDEVELLVKYLDDNHSDKLDIEFEGNPCFMKNGITERFLKNGGFSKIESDLNSESDFLKEKELLEFDNLKLQKEASEHERLIRDKNDQIRDLTRDNLRLGNWDIRFRWYIAVAGFIIGIITKYFIDN